MTVPTNDDFTNCELSIEELEAIAAGWPHWLKTAVHDIGKAAQYVAIGVGYGVIAVGAISIGNAFLIGTGAISPSSRMANE